MGSIQAQSKLSLVAEARFRSPCHGQDVLRNLVAPEEPRGNRTNHRLALGLRNMPLLPGPLVCGEPGDEDGQVVTRAINRSREVGRADSPRLFDTSMTRRS